MPVPVAALITGALLAGATRVVLSTIGLGIVTYVGVDTALSAAVSSMKSNMGAAGMVAQFAGLMGIDRAVSIIVTAFTIRVTMMPLKRLMML